MTLRRSFGIVGVILTLTIVNSSSQSCSIRFGSTTTSSVPNYVETEIGPNTFHVKMTLDPEIESGNEENEEERRNGSLKHHFGGHLRIPPAAIFECSSTHFIQFRINSVEAVRFVEIERSRLIPSNYTPLSTPDDYVNFLRVQVLLDANATGEYVFTSQSDHHIESFYIFAETEPIPLLGVGRRLSAFSSGNTLTIPCVSPNPKILMHLWRVDTKQEGFDEILVDNESVSYNPQRGFILTPNSRRDFPGYYRCSVDTSWHIPPFVEVDVPPTTGIPHHPDLSINLVSSGGAECYGIPGSDVKLYKMGATVDDAPEIIKCFEQRKLKCGERRLHQAVQVGSPVHPDQSGKASVSVLGFDDHSGLLVCTSQTETISTMFFKGLDGKYYGNEIQDGPIEVLLRIQLIPNPDKEVVFGGSVLTVKTEEAQNIFVDSPRLVFIQFRNGSTAPVQVYKSGSEGGSSRSFLASTDIKSVLVNDQFQNSGKTINILKSFSVKQRECGLHQFRCDSGECIAAGKLCDHRIHCRDGKSDEFNCQRFVRNCTGDEFKCTSGQCISASLQCSGNPECFDRSDEHVNCSSCGQGRFQCKNGECIRSYHVCDSDPDCDDESDEAEELCKDCNGDEDKFKCRQGGCILKVRVCDGYSHCEDGSDEEASFCMAVTPIIVNEEVVYEFPLHKNNYLVCEVIIPQQQAHEERFQPHVNWTFTPWNRGLNASRRPLDLSKIIGKHKTRRTTPKIEPAPTNFTTFHFVYKLKQFDESKEGVYGCIAYNDIGSQRRDLLVLANQEECAPHHQPTSPRPGHEGRPPVAEEEEEEVGGGPSFPGTFQCRGPGKYPDPDNCAVFHDCITNGEGYLDYRFNCAPGTVFCPKSQHCGWEAECPCNSIANRL